VGIKAFRKAHAAAIAAALANSARTADTKAVTKAADKQLPLAPPPAVPAQPQGPTTEEFSTLRAKLAEFEASDTKSRAKIDELEQDRKRIAEAHNRERIRFTALNLAERAGAVNAEQVVRLLVDDFSLTEAGEVVTTADPKIGAETHIKTFLDANAHFRKPQVAAGSGASPFPASAPGAAPKADLTTDAGLTDYARQLTHQAVAQQHGTQTATPSGPGRVN